MKDREEGETLVHLNYVFYGIPHLVDGMPLTSVLLRAMKEGYEAESKQVSIVEHANETLSNVDFVLTMFHEEPVGAVYFEDDFEEEKG